jgi:hypothetical protein
MPDPARPYEFHSELELLEERRLTDEALAYHQGRLAKMPHYDDDRRAVKDRVSELYGVHSAIQAEFDRRRKEREAGTRS